MSKLIFIRISTQKNCIGGIYRKTFHSTLVISNEKWEYNLYNWQNSEKIPQIRLRNL